MSDAVRDSGHRPMEAVHADDRSWETLRWPGQWSKNILEGEFEIGEATYGPGTMLFYPDPHSEPPLATKTGGLMLFVQYQGPTTQGRPIYDGRFNMTSRKPVSEERVDV